MSTSTPGKVRASNFIAEVSQRHSSWSESIKSLKDCNRTDNARNELVRQGLGSNLVPGTSVSCVAIPCHGSRDCQQLWEAASH